ncbi:hypothetical protein [Thermofilum sp.]|uniref:hypothetical protein n=1 Tax=Thermofilum sp. TaxID=1961369 RepID=UPI00315E79A8
MVCSLRLRGLLFALGALLIFGLPACCCIMLVNSWGRVASQVNLRWSPSDPRIFVTPGDASVQATVRSAVYGNVNPARDEELRLYLRLLYDWVSTNIRVRSDSLYPVLPSLPNGQVSFISEVWQFPNETLTLRSGDCEDSATLLLSMIRFYAPRLKAFCIVVEGGRGGHMAVIVSNGSGVAILDPGLYYCTSDEVGRVKFKPLMYELEKWLALVKQRFGSEARVTMLFNEETYASFRSTSEFIAFFLLKIDA